jgi:hypothetical protein
LFIVIFIIMKFLITENKLNNIIENLFNERLQNMRNYFMENDDTYELYGEYDPSYISAIINTDKIDVIDVIKDEYDWWIKIIIHSNVGDFDWGLLEYDLQELAESTLGFKPINVIVKDYKWSKDEEE